MLSNACAYGLRAMTYLASQPQDHYVAVDTVAQQVHLPSAFLRKVMQKLGRARFITSMRGAGGGVRLSEDSKSITVYDIILAIDGDKRFTRCMLHLNGCDAEKPCPFHEEWTAQRSLIQKHLQSLSLNDITTIMKKEVFDYYQLDQNTPLG
jgi:Rrf2 family iron-sulfur cluster assembly transcriptional regulator